MCGIAGIITMDIEPRNIARVRRMLNLLVHRGPDDTGVFEDRHVCLGHRRLSIIDISQAGHQPMENGKKAVLLFNGEIYNHNDLRQELMKEGFSFRGRCDAEVLLYGYQLWSDEVVNKLKGFFAFSIWDAGNQRLFCARDPFGKKPFYYFWDYRKFVFASEVEAVIAGLDARPDLNYKGLSHYLLKGYFPMGESVYEPIHTLKAGHCLSIDIRNAKLHEWPYWNPRFELDQTSPVDKKEITELCGKLLDAAVKRRLESDVPTGVLLSGGVDSSLVTLVAAEHFPSQLRTFTATFKGTTFDEGFHAMQVAERAQSNHLEVDIPVEGLPSILSRLVKAYGEPFGDYSAIPTFLLFQAIKPHVTVALTGDGGDEVFAGYKDAKLFLFRETLLPFLGFAGRLAIWFPDRMIYSRWRHARELGYALIAMRPNGAESFYSLQRDGWTRFWRNKLMRPEAWRLTGDDAIDEEVKQQFINSGRDDMERYLNLSLERLTQDFLVKIDRASMAHSIEARCPMLDVDLFTLVSGLSSQILLQNGETKSILKDLLDSRMGDGFARRTKKGFTPPLTEWFREEKYCRWLEKQLTGKNSFVYSLFNPDGIRWLLRQHCSGQDHTARLWILLFLNEWHAHFFGR